jgi:thiamine-monophosphate kinase
MPAKGATVTQTGTARTSLHPEIALIERIAASLATRPGVSLGIGDDAAVLEGDPPLVVTQDLLIEDVHFRSRTTGARALGHKALAVGLSDVAAMGGVPVAAVVGLALPRSRRDDVSALYAGIETLAALHGCTIAGGDIADAPALMLSVTVIGRMPPGVAPVTRSGARPGDVLCVTGTLGAAAAGLLVLEDPALATGIPPAVADDLRDAHRAPEPRVAAGQALAAGGARAMLDCSDGLALDTWRMAQASGVAVEIDLERLPLAPGVAAVAEEAGREADVLAATGGEDYELIVALEPDAARRLSTELDVPLTPVGAIVAGAPGRLTVRRRGAEVALPRLGWEHGA